MATLTMQTRGTGTSRRPRCEEREGIIIRRATPPSAVVWLCRTLLLHPGCGLFGPDAASAAAAVDASAAPSRRSAVGSRPAATRSRLARGPTSHCTVVRSRLPPPGPFPCSHCYSVLPPTAPSSFPIRGRWLRSVWSASRLHAVVAASVTPSAIMEAATRHTTTATDGVRLSYTLVGSGPTKVLCIPGMCTPGAMWAPQVAAFIPGGQVSMALVDNRTCWCGYGGSGGAGRGGWVWLPLLEPSGQRPLDDGCRHHMCRSCRACLTDSPSCTHCTPLLALPPAPAVFLIWQVGLVSLRPPGPTPLPGTAATRRSSSPATRGRSPPPPAGPARSTLWATRSAG